MTVEIKRYDAPPVCEREILRYAGVRRGDAATEALMRDCLCELGDRLTYRVCFAELPLCVDNDWIRLSTWVFPSRDLGKNLVGCDRAVVFAATVGMEIDRLIARYRTLSPSRSLLFQAIGSERAEALCARFCEELAEREAHRGYAPRPRFSPGYGDLSLTTQTHIFEILDCAKHIGVSLNESLLMSPSKSVTAIVGLAPSDRKTPE